LVTSRTPGFCDMPFFMNLFHKALVAHVDLSVLVWFLSIACMFWSLAVGKGKSFIPYLSEAAQICFVLGMIFISISPFDQKAEGVMSNYIPVITSPLFFFGLSLLLCGVGLMLARLFTSSTGSDVFAPPLRFAVFSSGIIAVFAIFAFVWSFNLLPPEIVGQQYYEIGFWGGGHVLQFIHTQILLVCWLWLAIALKPDFSPSKNMLYGLFSVGLIAALATPLPYLLFEVTSSQYRAFFTNGMIAAGGIAPSLLALFIIPVLWKTRSARKGNNRALWATLLMSLILFIYGGILAGLIHGQNVVIPAHYHGSIVGVTLAFMGISYLLLPFFGYQNVAGWRMAFWQPLVYGFGQLLHISGLAYSGGYGGLQRKTPGMSDAITTSVKAAMGLMGLGGLLAIIGGIMFVLVVARSVYGKKNLVAS
ncbi:MAG: hypothetical protein ABL857_08400, partial [Rickettsiales bacterium]